jgi:hypothetical protein
MTRKIPQYSIGDKLVSCGEEIIGIAGQSKRAGVFIVTGEKIKWEWYESDDIPKYVHLANSILNDIYFRIVATISQERRSSLIREVAGAFFSAIDAGDDEIAPYFSAISEQVAFRSNANQSYRYIVGSIIGVAVCGVLSTLLWILVFIPKSIFIGISGGAFGALVSVLQRISKLGLSKFAPLWYSFFQGAARTGLGALFGVFFVLANQGDIAMSAYKSNNWAIAAFAVLAGASERFVPELIKRMEGLGKQNNDENKGRG